MHAPQLVVSVCVGALCSLFFLTLGQSKAMCWRAWYPTFIVIAIDAAVAVGVFPILGSLHPQAVDMPSYWQAIAAGFVGPTIIRAKSPDSWKVLGGKRLFGPFRGVQERAGLEIERICTAAEVEWLDRELVKLTFMTLDEVKEWTSQFLSRVQRKEFDQRKRRATLNLVRDTAVDAASNEDVRKRTIVQILLDADSHKAVKSLVRHARRSAPRPVLRKPFFYPWIYRRLSENGLYHRLVLPTDYRKDKIDGRVRVGYPDRHVDDSLCQMAQRMASELSGIARVEGVYEGWITVSSPLKARDSRRYARVIGWLTESVTTRAMALNAVVQSDCTVLDEERGLYATASLVVSAVSPETHDNAFCGTAFCAQRDLSLAAEIVVAPDGVQDGRQYKKNLYGRAGVPVYLVFDLANCETVVYSEPENGGYRNEELIPLGEPLTLPRPLALTLDTKLLVE